MIVLQAWGLPKCAQRMAGMQVNLRGFPDKTMSTTPFQDAVLATNPIRYWRLNESSGTTAVDQAGNDNGTYVGVTLGQESPVNDVGAASVQFDGTDDYVLIGGVSDLDFAGGDAWSFGCWWRFDAVEGTIVAKGAGSTSERQYQFFHLSSVDRLLIHMGGSDNLNNWPEIFEEPDNQWYFVVFTCDGEGVVSLYVDAALQGTESEVGSSKQEVDVLLGARRTSVNTGESFFLEGHLSEAFFHDVELTAQQITDIYDAASAEPVSPAPYYYRHLLAGGMQ